MSDLNKIDPALKQRSEKEIREELDGCFCDDVHFNEPTCQQCIDNRRLLEEIRKQKYKK